MATYVNADKLIDEFKARHTHFSIQRDSEGHEMGETRTYARMCGLTDAFADAVAIVREHEELYGLNWRDIQRIVQIADNLCNSLDYEQIAKMRENGYYGEILRRFLEEKRE